MNKETVIAMWGMGPTYRERIIYHIQTAYNFGYDKIMKYVILTDRVEDFVGLEPHIQNLIIDVVDVFPKGINNTLPSGNKTPPANSPLNVDNVTVVYPGDELFIT